MREGCAGDQQVPILDHRGFEPVLQAAKPVRRACIEGKHGIGASHVRDEHIEFCRAIRMVVFPVLEFREHTGWDPNGRRTSASMERRWARASDLTPSATGSGTFRT